MLFLRSLPSSYRRPSPKQEFSPNAEDFSVTLVFLVNRGDRTGQAFPRGSVGSLSSQASLGQTWPERVRSVTRPIKGRRLLPPAIGEHVRPVVRPSIGRRLLQPSVGAESSKRSRLFSVLTLLARPARSQGPLARSRRLCRTPALPCLLTTVYAGGNAKGHGLWGAARPARPNGKIPPRSDKQF